MGELYNSGYTELFTVWGEQTLCGSKEPSVVCGYKLAPPGKYDERVSVALLMQTVAIITVTLVTCSCVVIGATAEYAELSVHDNYPL